MFALNAVRRAAAVAIRTDGSRRAGSVYCDVVSSPPMNRISFAEKLVHGVLLTVGIVAYPIISICQMAEIKREEYAAMEIPEAWQRWKEQQKK